MIDFRKYLDIAKTAAESASKALRRVDLENILNSNGRDVKHFADITSEKTIIEILNKLSDYPILSEESGQYPKIASNDYVWVVDPLDGTVNFSRGIKFTCISIALWLGNEPVLGVVYDFNHEELFTGIVGQGAYCNDLSIYASDVNDSTKAVLATGFPVNRDFSSNAIMGFLKKIQSYKKIRLLGSAGLSLAYVACGRCDAYFEEDIMIWDVAAGMALVKAAEGMVSYQSNFKKKWALAVRAGATFRHNRGGSRDTLRIFR